MAGIDPTINGVATPPPPPPPTQDASFVDGARTGKKVGEFAGGDIQAGQRAETDFGSFEEAAAYARGTGESTAIVSEQGRYVVYQTTEVNNGSWLLSSGSQFTRDAAVTNAGNIDAQTRPSDPNVVAMVTDDAYLVDFSTSTAPLSGPVSGPFAARIEAYGPGLESIKGQEAFEEQFELALRDTALYSLDQAEAVAKQTEARLQGTEFTPADRAAIDSALPKLQEVDARIADVQSKLSAVGREQFGQAIWDSVLRPPVLLGTASLFPSAAARALSGEAAELRSQLDALEVERISAAQEFPMLLRVDSTKFANMSEAQQVATLRGEAEGVLEDITTTRQNVIDGDFNLWTNGGLRNTVAAGLGLPEDRMAWVADRATSESRWEAATSIGTSVLGVGLAIGGAALAPFTAGSSLSATVVGGGMIAGGIGIGVYEAVTATQDYLRDQAAINTSIDPNAGLLPPEDAGHWGWVAAAWVGVGIDVAQAVSAVSKLAKAGSSVDDLLAATPQGQRALAQTADELGVTPQVLREALEGARDTSLSTGVMSSADFTRAFGSDVGEAVTLVGRAPDGTLDIQVVFRDGLTPTDRVAALGEEAVHVRQLTQDPALAKQAELLDEARLADWPNMADTQKLDTYRASLNIEIDAQQRIIAESAGTPQAAAAQERLTSLGGQLDEVDAALAGGRVPDWLADAAPPRLFAEPVYPRTNAAAEAAGYPAAPDGHYYRDLGEGNYELTRFPSSRSGWADPADVTPMRVQLNSDGTRSLVPREGTISASARRAEFEARFGEPLQSSTGQALEASLDAANIQSPFVRSYARSFNESLAQLDQLAGPGASDQLLARLAGMSDAQAETALRGALRSDTVAAIQDLPPAQQMPALLQAADALPGGSNRLRGELFTEFREGAMPAGFQAVEPATNGLRISGNSRIADGIMTVDSAVLREGDGPARAGRYLVEDKFGSSFNIDQARAYSEAMDGVGRITTRDGSVQQGVVYVFNDAQTASAAMRALDRVDGLSDTIHVAILRAPGEFQWLR